MPRPSHTLWFDRPNTTLNNWRTNLNYTCHKSLAIRIGWMGQVEYFTEHNDARAAAWREVEVLQYLSQDAQSCLLWTHGRPSMLTSITSPHPLPPTRSTSVSNTQSLANSMRSLLFYNVNFSSCKSECIYTAVKSYFVAWPRFTQLKLTRKISLLKN
jgi:hypothetical protein